MPEPTPQTQPKPLVTEPAIAARPFLLRTLLWLPICFIAWYAVADWLTMLAVWLSDPLLTRLMPGVVEALVSTGGQTILITPFKMQTTQGVALFSQAFAVLKYTFGLPLIMAILLATPYPISSKLVDFVYALITVILIQIWGTCFDSVHVLLNISPSITAVINDLLPYTQNEYFIKYLAHGKNLAFLIFPVMIPMALWINRHEGFLEQLAKR